MIRTTTRAEVEGLLERFNERPADELESQHLDFKEWDSRSTRTSRYGPISLCRFWEGRGVTERNLRSRPPTFLFVKCTRIAVFRIYSRIYEYQCNGNALPILSANVLSAQMRTECDNSHFSTHFRLFLCSRTCGRLPSGCSRMTNINMNPFYEAVNHYSPMLLEMHLQKTASYDRA